MNAAPIKRAEKKALINRLHGEVISEHEAAQRDMRNAIGHAIRCGLHLIEIKAQLGHGKFGPWCATLPFSYRTAKAYMQVARASNGQRAAHLDDSSIREAIKLASKNPKQKPEGKKRAAHNSKAAPDTANSQRAANLVDPDAAPAADVNTTKPKDLVMARILRDLDGIGPGELTNPNEAAQMLFRHAHRLSTATIFLGAAATR